MIDFMVIEGYITNIREQIWDNLIDEKKREIESKVVMGQYCFTKEELAKPPRTPEEIEKDWQKPENQKKLKEMIKEFGEYKKVIDAKSGVAYKVPTKDIITKGLKQQDLDKYPIWVDCDENYN